MNRWSCFPVELEGTFSGVRERSSETGLEERGSLSVGAGG